ncbi:MAG: hypothetical protein J5815_03355 [Clostridia bacterium]|nr:hypothetical protein [Clostridia bacterium]
MLFLIVVLLAVGCTAFLACHKESAHDPMKLYEGIGAEDLFELLEKSDSYSILVDGEEYHFVKGRGYTKLENGVFDGIYAGDGMGYRYHKEPAEVVEKEVVTLSEEFYDEIDDEYYKYVALLQTSFENMPSKEPVEFKTDEKGDRATIKIIVRRDGGSFSIIACEISGINSTELHFPD